MSLTNERTPKLSSREMTSLLSRLPMTSEEPTDDAGTMAAPKGQDMNLQLGIRVKKPNFSIQGLGVGMRKGADLEVDGPPTIMEPQQEQRPPQPMLAARGTVEAFPSPSPSAPEFPHSGVQPVSDTSRTRDADGGDGEDDAAFAARKRCQPVSDDSSDSDLDLMVNLELNKLVTGSGSGSDCATGGSEADSDSKNVVDLGGRRPAAENGCLHPPTQACAFEEEVAVEVEDGYQGLMYGTVKLLLNFVTELMYKPRKSGVSVWHELKPALVNGVLRYEEGKQFRVLENLQPSVQRSQQGVFLCEDLSSKRTFVLKKISTKDYRLPGLKFLVQHDKSFLPKIYAVYKENGMVWIFEEHIGGEIVAKCDWAPSQVHQFAGCLLSACRYLHDQGLAHCDLKLANVMVRDLNKPDSLVIIDFESARHEQGPVIEGGQGHTTTFLPPWHKKLPGDSSRPLLMVADLWAVACILVSLLEGSSWNQKHQQQHQQHQQEHLRDLGVVISSSRQQYQGGSRTIWAQKTAELVKMCRRQASPNEHGSQFCKRCRGWFLNYLETKGDQILSVHLGSLMAQSVEDLHWESLRELLEYLTDCSYIHDMKAGTALTKLEC